MDLNKRGKSKERGDMDAFLDRSEDVSSVQSTVPAATPVQIRPRVFSPSERLAPSPILTIVNSEILSTIPLPGEIVAPLINYAPRTEPQNHVETAPPVSPIVKTEGKENVGEESSTPKIVLKYSYKEDQWSPLNPEGKKQYDRDFLIQLQSQPMSLCKPSNLPNLDIIKNKAHIQRLPNYNRSVPMSVSSRAFDPFVSKYLGNNTRPPHPTPNRRSQQGRGGDKKGAAKLNVLPSNQNIKLHASENAWKPSHKVATSDDKAEIMPDEIDSICLGPGGRNSGMQMQSWGRGSSGGIKALSGSDIKTELTKRYSALAERSLTPSFENRRGSQRSAASSRKSSHGRNSQLPLSIWKTPSTSQERENLIEAVKGFDRSATHDSKAQEVKRNTENQLNGKTVEATTVLSLKGPEYSEVEIGKKTKPLIDLFPRNADFEKLDFTVSPTKVFPNTELSTQEIKTKLKDLLDSTDENEKIFDWIDAHVPSSALTETSFIRALATAVHEKAITGVGSRYKIDKNALIKRIPLLTRYIDHNEQLELQVLYAIQHLMNDLNQPKGILRQIFDILYLYDVITKDTFKQWEQSKDPNELEGKDVALRSVRRFFYWLKIFP